MSHDAILPPERVTIVGVINLTPDSFSDGGRFARGAGPVDVGAVVDEARALLDAGAHWLDLGGESTRPGAPEVDAAQECERVVPALEALAKRFPATLSVDTRKAKVARAALAAGARVVNDVTGLAHDPALAEVVAEHGAGLVVGHIRGTPETMQRAPGYDDVLGEVARELRASVSSAEAAGVARERIAVDPGIGFGKRLEDNLALVARAGWLRRRLGRPLLIGLSRKSFLGTLTGDPVEDRDLASHCAASVAVFAGADAVRVHDVDGARRAVAVGRALRAAARAGGDPADDRADDREDDRLDDPTDDRREALG
ncbi:MAG: dihydropteroate synthase [Myxococcota bacterium]